MISDIKTAGINSALFFNYAGDTYGAMKDNGTYRQLWYTSLQPNVNTVMVVYDEMSAPENAWLLFPLLLALPQAFSALIRKPERNRLKTLLASRRYISLLSLLFAPYVSLLRFLWRLMKQPVE